jgi:hypothetical protein
VVTHIESAIKHKDITLGAFLDIEGAFDRTSFNIIKQATEKHGIEPATCRWISAILERTCNMQVDKCYTGKQGHNYYIIRRNPGGVRM